MDRRCSVANWAGPPETLTVAELAVDLPGPYPEFVLPGRGFSCRTEDCRVLLLPASCRSAGSSVVRHEI